MSNTTNVLDVDPVDSALIQKYAPTILSAAIVIFGGLQVLVTTGHSLSNILVFAALVITTATTFQLSTRWKLYLETAGVVVSAVLPFAIEHTVTWSNGLLIAVAVVKALATAFGIAVRADSSVAPAFGTLTVVHTPAASTPDVEPVTETHEVAVDDGPTVGEYAAAQDRLRAQLAAVSEAVKAPEPAPKAVPRPNRSAKVAEWVAYAKTAGYDESLGYTKAQLIAQYDA